jgi:hypothetical protein
MDKKRVLILEDGYISNQMEDCIVKLKSLGYRVHLVENCYENYKTIEKHLSTPLDVLLIQTTFTYQNKMSALLPLLKVIKEVNTKKIDFWIHSHAPGAIFNVLPYGSKKCFRFYEFNIMGFVDDVFKRELKKCLIKM